MAFSERFFSLSSSISFEKEDLEFIQFFLSFFKIISLGNPAVTFGALIPYPNKRKYLVKKAFIYDETGVFIIVSGYCILVRIYFSEEIRKNRHGFSDFSKNIIKSTFFNSKLFQ